MNGIQSTRTSRLSNSQFLLRGQPQFQTVGMSPSLLSQPMGLDTFTRTQPALTPPPVTPIRDVIVMDDFTNVQAGNFQHGTEMVKEMLSVNPNLNISKIDVGQGNALANIDQSLTQLLNDINSGKRPVPQGLNLSMFWPDPSAPHVQDIKAKLNALADKGTLITTVAGKVVDANGKTTNTSIKNPGDHVVRNELADDNNPNIIKVEALGEKIGAENGADIFEPGRTTSFASAHAMGELSLKSAQGQQVVQPPVTGTTLPAVQQQPPVQLDPQPVLPLPITQPRAGTGQMDLNTMWQQLLTMFLQLFNPA